MTNRQSKQVPWRQAMKDGRRHCGGSSLIEVIGAMVVMMAMLIFVLDIGIIMLAYGVNDRACRDAARAAAQGATQQESIDRALAMLDSYSSTGGFIITPPSLQNDTLTFQPPQPEVPGAPPPPPAFVTVATISTVRVPCPLVLPGITIGEDGVQTIAQYTFPITGIKVPPPAPPIP